MAPNMNIRKTQLAASAALVAAAAIPLARADYKVTSMLGNCTNSDTLIGYVGQMATSAQCDALTNATCTSPNTRVYPCTSSPDELPAEMNMSLIEYRLYSSASCTAGSMAPLRVGVGANKCLPYGVGVQRVGGTRITINSATNATLEQCSDSQCKNCTSSSITIATPDALASSSDNSSMCIPLANAMVNLTNSPIATFQYVTLSPLNDDNATVTDTNATDATKTGTSVPTPSNGAPASRVLSGVSVALAAALVGSLALFV